MSCSGQLKTKSTKMHHTVQMVTLVRKEFIQPFPVETFHRPPDALFEGFRIFPRRGKCWTYLGKSPKKVLKLNLAVEMVVWRYNFVIGKIKLSMLKRCRGEVVWTNSMTWIWQVIFPLLHTLPCFGMVQLKRQVSGSPKMMSSSKKVLTRNMKRSRQQISPEQFNKWPHTDPERF